MQQYNPADYKGDNITCILAVERDQMADLAKYYIANHDVEHANYYFNRVSVLNWEIMRAKTDALDLAPMEADLIINNQFN